MAKAPGGAGSESAEDSDVSDESDDASMDGADGADVDGADGADVDGAGTTGTTGTTGDGKTDDKADDSDEDDKADDSDEDDETNDSDDKEGEPGKTAGVGVDGAAVDDAAVDDADSEEDSDDSGDEAAASGGAAAAAGGAAAASGESVDEPGAESGKTAGVDVDDDAVDDDAVDDDAVDDDAVDAELESEDDETAEDDEAAEADYKKLDVRKFKYHNLKVLRMLKKDPDEQFNAFHRRMINGGRRVTKDVLAELEPEDKRTIAEIFVLFFIAVFDSKDGSQSFHQLTYSTCPIVNKERIITSKATHNREALNGFADSPAIVEIWLDEIGQDTGKERFINSRSFRRATFNPSQTASRRKLHLNTFAGGPYDKNIKRDDDGVIIYDETLTQPVLDFMEVVHANGSKTRCSATAAKRARPKRNSAAISYFG